MLGYNLVLLDGRVLLVVFSLWLLLFFIDFIVFFIFLLVGTSRASFCFVNAFYVEVYACRFNQEVIKVKQVMPIMVLMIQHFFNTTCEDSNLFKFKQVFQVVKDAQECLFKLFLRIKSNS